MLRSITFGALLLSGCLVNWDGDRWSDGYDRHDDADDGWTPDYSYGGDEGGGDDAWGGGEGEGNGGSLAACDPGTDALRDVESLYGTTDQSVHELVTCGGLQMSLSRGFVVALVMSNADLVTPEALAGLGGGGFTRVPDGSYEMPVGDGSRFALRFFEAGQADPIALDVFQLDNYLAGARVDASISYDEMQEDWDRPCRFAFSFEGPGPLAHLLNDGEPLRDTFVVDLSLSDVLGLLWGTTGADLGPFDSLLQSLEVESELEFVDDRGDVVVEYSARGARSSLRSTNDTGQLTFDVPALRSTSGTLTMQAGASTVEYLSLGTLAGVIDYSVLGPDLELGIRSDFGNGRAYPETYWYCP